MTNPDTYALIESLWLESKFHDQTPQSAAWLVQVEQWLQERRTTEPWPWATDDDTANTTFPCEPPVRSTS